MKSPITVRSKWPCFTVPVLDSKSSTEAGLNVLHFLLLMQVNFTEVYNSWSRESYSMYVWTKWQAGSLKSRKSVTSLHAESCVCEVLKLPMWVRSQNWHLENTHFWMTMERCTSRIAVWPVHDRMFQRWSTPCLCGILQFYDIFYQLFVPAFVRLKRRDVTKCVLPHSMNI